jgi:hypothetical protein
MEDTPVEMYQYDIINLISHRVDIATIIDIKLKNSS